MRKITIVLFCFALFLQTYCSAQTGNKYIQNIYNPALEIIAFYPGNGIQGYYLTGETVKQTLVIRNAGKEAVNAEITVSAADFFGNPYGSVLTRKVELPPLGKTKQEFQFHAGKQLGYFTVNASIAINGKKAGDTQSAFVVVEPPAAKRDPFFAADVGNLYLPSLDGQRMAGFGSIGISTEQFTSDPDKVESEFYNNSGIKKLLQSDFQVVGYFTPLIRTIYNKRGRSDKEFMKRIDQRIKDGLPSFNDDDVKLAYELGKRTAELTKDRIKLWIVRSEYDVKTLEPKRFGGDAFVLAETVVLTRAFYRGIKAGNPKAKVAVLGTMGIDYYPSFRASNKNNPFALSKMILKDLRGEWDYLAIDAYSDGRIGSEDNVSSSAEAGLRDFLNATVELSVAYNGPAVVINSERGAFCSWLDPLDSVSMKNTAYDLVRSLIISKSTPCAYYSQHMPVDQWKPYYFRKGGQTGINKDYAGGRDYGVIWRAAFNEKNTISLTPRPAGAVHAAAARELAFVRPGKEFRMLDIYGYTFARKDGSSLICLWSVGRNLELALTLPDGGTMADMMGNRTPLRSGKNIFNLTGAPCYISLPCDIAAADAILGKSELVNQTSVLADGRRLGLEKARVFFMNQERKAKTISASIDGGPEVKIALNALERKQMDIKLPATCDRTATLQIKDGGKMLSFPFDTSFLTVPKLTKEPLFDGSGAWFANLGGGKLKMPENVYPKAALMEEWKIFNKTASDPNAEYFTAYDDKNFYFAVRMNNDKKHIQGKGKDLWRGDSIQFAFTTRDVFPEKLRSPSEQTPFTSAESNMSLALVDGNALLYSYSGGGQAPGFRKYRKNVTRKGDTVIYETAIPWSDIGITPNSDEGFRFTFTVFDYDDPSGARAYWFALTPGLAGKNDPSKFKTFLFGK